MSQVKKIPDEYHTITPMLIVKDGLKAIEYYKKVFGATDKGIMMMPDNKAVAHAELKIGDSNIMLSDEFPEMKCLSPISIGGSPISLYLYVEDVDKTFNLSSCRRRKIITSSSKISFGEIGMESSKIHLDIFGQYQHT